MERLTPLGLNDRQIPEAIRMVFTVKPVHFYVNVQSTMETVVTTLFNGMTGVVCRRVFSCFLKSLHGYTSSGSGATITDAGILSGNGTTTIDGASTLSGTAAVGGVYTNESYTPSCCASERRQQYS